MMKKIPTRTALWKRPLIWLWNACDRYYWLPFIIAVAAAVVVNLTN